MPDPIVQPPDATPESPPPDPRMADLERDLQAARDALANAQRDHAIERALIQAGALDLAAATALAQAAHAGALASGDAPDPARIVLDLRRAHPALFASPTPRATALRHADPPDPVCDALDAARASGDRRTLLNYLRLKRA